MLKHTRSDVYCPDIFYCFVLSTIYISVKLSGKFNASMGGVLVYHDDQWHSVCDNDFDSRDARVACRTLGFADGKVIHGSAFGNLSSSIGELDKLCIWS